MMFGDNVLRIQHGSGFGIEFNATDALRCVNNYQGMLKVACAEEWQESRWESGQLWVKPSRELKETILEWGASIIIKLGSWIILKLIFLIYNMEISYATS